MRTKSNKLEKDINNNKIGTVTAFNLIHLQN